MRFGKGFWKWQWLNYERCAADCKYSKGAHVLRYRFWVVNLDLLSVVSAAQDYGQYKYGRVSDPEFFA